MTSETTLSEPQRRALAKIRSAGGWVNQLATGTNRATLQKLHRKGLLEVKKQTGPGVNLRPELSCLYRAVTPQ